MVERRQALRARYLDVIVGLADECMALTRFREARECLERGLRLDPLREDLQERMMRALAGMGRRQEAVEHYRQYRALLRGRLGLEPPEALQLQYARLID